MAVLHSPESPYAKEATKWEAQHTSMGPGLRPYVRREYPMMLHLAGRTGQGKSGAPVIIEQVVLEDDRQMDYYKSRGFRETPLEAIDALTAQEKEFAELAAERAYEVHHTKLSQKAIDEVAAAEAAVGGHLPTVPETPIVKKKPVDLSI